MSKIAFQGELGAYSHLACEEIFPGSEIKPARLLKKHSKPLSMMRIVKLLYL